MTNPQRDADLTAQLAAILGDAPHDLPDGHQGQPSEDRASAEAAAAPEQHEAHAAEPEHAPEPEHTEAVPPEAEQAPVFALVTPVPQEAPPPEPHSEPEVIPPPAEEHAAAAPSADELMTELLRPANEPEPAIDLTPIAEALAVPAPPRAELFEEPPHETPAEHHDAPVSEAPVAIVAEPIPSEPATIPAAIPVAAVAAVAAAPRAPTAGFVARSVAAMTWLLPYSLIALALRLVIARLFFAHGQAKIEGPSYLISSQDLIGWPGVHWVVTLPMTIKDSALVAFEKMANLPMPSWLAAPLVTYAEFILPICLVLGLATRFAALALFIMTVVIAFVSPETFWTTQVFWAAVLLVLMSRGPGVVSIDAIIRHFHRK